MKRWYVVIVRFFIKGEGTRTIGRATLRDGVATSGDKVSYNLLRKVGGDSSQVEVVREGVGVDSLADSSARSCVS